MSTPATRRSERKRAVNTRIADLDSSPTTQRAQPPSRKRKAGTPCACVRITLLIMLQASTQAPARPRPRHRSPEEEVPETFEDSDDETAIDDKDVPEGADIIIPFLAVSKDPIAMTHTHANSRIEERYGNETIQAFAKVCGKDWTYYVQDATVYFGREQAPTNQRSGAESNAQDNAEDSPPIQIDLGPSKVVSRTHAAIKYADDLWHVHAYGRNGVKLDDEDLRRGQSRSIRSGTVIAIAGTEMLFQIADEEPIIDQRYTERVVKHDEEQGNGVSHDILAGGLPPAPSFYPVYGPRNGGRPPFQYPPPASNVYPGRPNIAPASAGMTRLVTPEPSPPKQATTGSTKKRSPANRRGVNGIMMESTEQIDYALESSSDLKPACSYAAMITWAIISTPDQALSLSGIYTWIKAHYAFYRHAEGGWQNSIRHNLSLNAAFFKIPRRADEPGKGMKWALDPKHRDTTLAQANKNASKGGGRVSSAPNSPAGGPVSSSGFLPTAPNGQLKSSPTSRTPPLSSYPPTQQESFTPTRGPQMPAYAPTQGSLPVLSDETSPIPRRRTNGQLAAADSSPTLTSGAWAHDAPMRTPAPRPHNLNVPQPNTAKLPTSHMADSSPAPFWRFDAIGSTPARPWPDLSPMKANGTLGGPALPSSSPPPVANGAESPTRKARAPMFGGSQHGASRGEDDDGGIDITRGFPKISSFHEQRSNANGVAS